MKNSRRLFSDIFLFIYLYDFFLLRANIIILYSVFFLLRNVKINLCLKKWSVFVYVQDIIFILIFVLIFITFQRHGTTLKSMTL